MQIAPSSPSEALSRLFTARAVSVHHGGGGDRLSFSASTCSPDSKPGCGESRNTVTLLRPLAHHSGRRCQHDRLRHETKSDSRPITGACESVNKGDTTSAAYNREGCEACFRSPTTDLRPNSVANCRRRFLRVWPASRLWTWCGNLSRLGAVLDRFVLPRERPTLQWRLRSCAHSVARCKPHSCL